MMQRVLLDLNNPVFQEKFFALEREEMLAAAATLRRIRAMTWQELYQDHGLRWEVVRSLAKEPGSRVCSFRITRRVRALAYRDGDALRFLSVHADHDSAYKK